MKNFVRLHTFLGYAQTNPQILVSDFHLQVPKRQRSCWTGKGTHMASCTDMGSKEQEGCAANTAKQETTCEQNKGKDQQVLHAQSNILALTFQKKLSI